MMDTGTLHRSLKEKQRQERANLILQAAEDVFMEKGYYDASMDEIAARVGIAKGTVYLHFPGKQELVFALFEREMELFLSTVVQNAAFSLSARARLEGILYHVYRELPGQRIQLLLSLSSSMDVRKNFLEKKELLHNRMDEISARISALFEEGKEAGEFETTLPTSVMVSSFFSLLSPHAYRRLLDAKLLSPEELATHIGHIYFQGITTAHPG
jgi:TetR/AcrR family transcriptional regulator, fatty acid metabolism regulator protein